MKKVNFDIEAGVLGMVVATMSLTSAAAGYVFGRHMSVSIAPEKKEKSFTEEVEDFADEVEHFVE